MTRLTKNVEKKQNLVQTPIHQNYIYKYRKVVSKPS